MYKRTKLIYKIILPSILVMLCASCQSNGNNIMKTPQIVPGVEIKRKVEQAPKVKQTLGIIGEIEPVYILPMKGPFQARIDTGAQSSSIDVSEYNLFERDGASWVSFTIINRETGEKQNFEKKVEVFKKIKRIEDNERRVFVVLEMRIGNQIIKERFSLAKRDKFNYQVLIGRNILTGRAIVDTSVKNTLK